MATLPGGLFGTGIGSSREDVMQQILQEQQARNVARTQGLGKYAGLAQGGMETAQQFTRGVGQLFGAEDPRLQKQSKIQEAAEAVRATGVDMNDPLAVYQAFSQELLNRGLYNEATALIPKIQDAQMKQRELGTRERAVAVQEEQNNISKARLQFEVDREARQAKLTDAQINEINARIDNLKADKYSFQISRGDPLTGTPTQVIAINKSNPNDRQIITLGPEPGSAAPGGTDMAAQIRAELERRRKQQGGPRAGVEAPAMPETGVSP